MVAHRTVEQVEVVVVGVVAVVQAVLVADADQEREVDLEQVGAQDARE